MDINIIKLQHLFEDKAAVYEELGKEHFPIRNLKEYENRCDISAHLHCEVVELWLSVLKNQSLEQIFDELVDILCVWNLALVLYQNANGQKIDYSQMIDDTNKLLQGGDYLQFSPDAKKNWIVTENVLDSDFIKNIDDSIIKNKINCVFNLGHGNELDIFSLYHKTINDFWNSIRRNKSLDEIYKNLLSIFIIWMLSVRVISKHIKFEISFDNIFEVADNIFTEVAKKKFNINI